jgi:hypothetical protein
MAQLASAPITLDPTDPFDAALIPLVETNRRKRADSRRTATRSTTSRRPLC